MSASLNSDPVGVLITGGTLDKTHDTATESLVLDGETRVPDIFTQGRTKISRFEILIQIDSLDMTDVHRSRILTAVKQRQKTASSSLTAQGQWNSPQRLYTDRSGKKRSC